LDPEVANMLCAAAGLQLAAAMMTRTQIIQRYTRGKYAFPLHISRVVLLLLRQRRGRGNDLGTTIKCLRKTTSGVAGNDLDTTMKYP
jgi:hypothetical protein